MSNRAEGCGQWLSTNTKRTKSQLSALPGGKSKNKKKKRLLNFASRSNQGQHGGLNIHVQVSCSPLSPRTVRKLQNAKQSKLDRFFKAEGKSNSNGCAKDNKAASSREGSLEDLEKLKRVKIPVKRQREDSSSGFNTEALQTHEHPIYSQEMEVTNTTDLNISGISHLNDSIDSSDGLDENNLLQVSEPDKDRDLQDTYTLTPPTKKRRTSKSGSSLTGSRTTERVDSALSAENEPSQSFHFSQWRNDQIAKCKEIQDGDFTECSSCADMGSLTSAEEESGLELNHNSAGGEFSEMPPFQFTQWAKQQVEACRKIQKEADSPEMTLHQSLNSGEQTYKPKFGSRHTINLQMLNGHPQADSEFDFSEWARNQIKLCRNLQQTEDSTDRASIDWEGEKWDEWILAAGKTACTSQLHSAESEFQFSQWVKSQVRKCRNTIQENSD